jgi:hypothetical protein
MCFGLWFEMEWIWSGFARVFGGNAEAAAAKKGGKEAERGCARGMGICEFFFF